MQYTSFDKKTSESITETARQNMEELQDMLKQQHALELAQAFARGHDAGWQSAMAHVAAQLEQQEPYGQITVVKRPGCVDMQVKIDGVVYESEAARYLCEGCAARYDIGLCADINEKFPCTDFIWMRKEIEKPIENLENI